MIGYDAVLKGKLIIFNELKLKIVLNWIIPFLPRRNVLRLIKSIKTK